MRQMERSQASKAREIAALRLEAIGRVNDITGMVRARFVTPLPGQDNIYADKEAEAKSFLAQDPEPVDLTPWPFLAAETGITAPSVYELAQLWLNMGALWRAVGSTIEGQRMSAIRQIDVASDAGEIESIVAAFELAIRDW